MNLRHLKKIALGVFLLSLASSAAVALETAGSTPKGAVKLTQSTLREKAGYYCGYVQKRWVPGRILSATTFYPTDAELSNLNAELKKASGRRKTRLNKQIAEMKKAAGSRRLHCSAIAKSGTKTRLTKVLKTQSGKWSRFHSLRRVSDSSIPTPPIVQPQTSDIIFNLSEAVALAQPQTPSGSNLLAVSRNGTASDALLSGSASIAEFYSLPNGKIYVVFQSGVPLVGGGEPCVLAEVDSNTGVPTCIDSSLWRISPLGSNRLSIEPLQFDDAGNLFYIANSIYGSSVLRRYSHGQVSDISLANIQLNMFLVMPDGSLILSGLTGSSGVGWIRRLSAQGSLSTLVSGTRASFLARFTDGNVYFGLDQSNGGVRRFIYGSQTLDPKFWFGFAGPQTPHFEYETMCLSDLRLRSAIIGFCSWGGALVDAMYPVPGVGTYGVVQGLLMQYYPTIEKQESAVDSIILSQAAGKGVVLTGLNSNKQNITTVFNLETKVETIVVDASNEIEMYKLTYAEDINRILFNGLRFSDNQYVVGEIDLSE